MALQSGRKGVAQDIVDEFGQIDGDKVIDNDLKTNSKTIVGAINELKAHCIGNGQESYKLEPNEEIEIAMTRGEPYILIQNKPTMGSGMNVWIGHGYGSNWVRHFITRVVGANTSTYTVPYSVTEETYERTLLRLSPSTTDYGLKVVNTDSNAVEFRILKI